MPVKTIEWISLKSGAAVPGAIRIIDQTLLPTRVRYINLTTIDAVWRAIKTLQVRGAPAIGIAAAMGVVIAIQRGRFRSHTDLLRAVKRAADHLATSRPTAVNLFWALDRMRATAARTAGMTPAAAIVRLACEANAVLDEDRIMCRAIGAHGARLLRDGNTVLTHCNAGGLATGEFGTALAPIYIAQEQGTRVRVFSDETRPLLQGSRLTAWELQKAGVDVTVICDNTAGQVMREGRIDAVMVGADRIAANGDAANKIGTYSVAVLARHHRIPFYVLAPTSTFDMTLANGGGIPIEERDPREVTRGFGRQTAPDGVKVYSPAFDVTPAPLITAIICEHGIARPPFRSSLRRMAAKS